MQYSSDIKKSSSDSIISINNSGELRVTYGSHIRRYEGRQDYQLIYICEGRCVVTLDNAVQIAYPGDCILYRPGEVQDYQLPKNVKCHTYWIHFTGSFCEKLFDSLSLQDVHIVSTEQNREIEHLIARICRYYNLNIPNRELICSGLMQSVLGLLSNEARKASNHGGGENPDRISELISRIKMVPNLNFTVAECAEFCHLSKAHFARVFKQTTGTPPVQFMLGLRIERAKELLDYTDMAIVDIAESSGFQDQNYFARTFRKSTGMSPTQYRRVGKTE